MRRLPLLAALLLVAAGCGRGKPHSSANPNELRYPIVMEPDSLDPQASNSIATGELLQNVYEGLLTLDEKAQPAPCLASKWEISPDGRTFTFHLDPRAAFTNGRHVTAADVKWSLERWCWPETKAPSVQPVMQYVVGGNDVMAGKRRDLPGVRVLDPATVQITIDRPGAYMLFEVGTASILCREAVESVHGRFGIAQAVGTGPFVLKEYSPGRRVVLEANRAYFRGRPPLDRIVRPIVVNGETAHLQYENGEVDACLIPLLEYARDTKDVRLQAQGRAIQTGSLAFVGMAPQLAPAFRDPRVRMAIAKAIDREAVSRIAYQGYCRRADGVLPPGVLGSDGSAQRLTYDPPAAQKLLAEAGFPGGRGFPALTLCYLQASPNYSAAAQIVRDSLKQNLGIEVNLQEREQATFIADSNGGRLPFYIMRWTAVDPHDFLPTLLGSHSDQNHFGYRNPKFDALCERADTEADPHKRAALYRAADEMATNDAPLIPLVNSGEFWLVKPYVHDLQSNLGGLMPHYKTQVTP